MCGRMPPEAARAWQPGVSLMRGARAAGGGVEAAPLMEPDASAAGRDAGAVGAGLSCFGLPYYQQVGPGTPL